MSSYSDTVRRSLGNGTHTSHTTTTHTTTRSTTESTPTNYYIESLDIKAIIAQLISNVGRVLHIVRRTRSDGTRAADPTEVYAQIDLLTDINGMPKHVINAVLIKMARELRTYATMFRKEGVVESLICDEAVEIDEAKHSIDAIWTNWRANRVIWAVSDGHD
jgi:hypothetical protein